MNPDMNPAVQPIAAIPLRHPSQASHREHRLSLVPKSDGLPFVRRPAHEEGWDIPIPFHLIFFIIIPMIFVLFALMVLGVFIGLGWGFMRWVLFGEPVAEHRCERYEEYEDEVGCDYLEHEEGYGYSSESERL